VTTKKEIEKSGFCCACIRRSTIHRCLNKLNYRNLWIGVAYLAAARSVVASRDASTFWLPPPPPGGQRAERTRCSTSNETTRSFPDLTCCRRCLDCRPSCPTAAGLAGCRGEWRSRASIDVIKLFVRVFVTGELTFNPWPVL
jgi:hypothetical protein